MEQLDFQQPTSSKNHRRVYMSQIESERSKAMKVDGHFRSVLTAPFDAGTVRFWSDSYECVVDFKLLSAIECSSNINSPIAYPTTLDMNQCSKLTKTTLETVLLGAETLF